MSWPLTWRATPEDTAELLRQVGALSGELDAIREATERLRADLSKEVAGTSSELLRLLRGWHDACTAWYILPKADAEDPERSSVWEAMMDAEIELRAFLCEELGWPAADFQKSDRAGDAA